VVIKEVFKMAKQSGSSKTDAGKKSDSTKKDSKDTKTTTKKK
jgi:hypothetical protein